MIDADAHVIECDATWSFMDRSEESFRPHLISRGEGHRQYWLIDGKIFGARANMNRKVPPAILQMEDIEGRLRHMDELGTEVQVLYPSLFLKPLTSRREVENALCRSYNRWLARACGESGGRLRWIAVLPLKDMDETLAEIQFAKTNGACGLFTRGLVDDKILSDPYFFPLYEEASRRNLPVCVHASQGNFDWVELFDREGGFAKFKLAVLSAFHSLVHDGIPKRFPELRLAFVEVSAQWIPYVVLELKRRFDKLGKPFSKNLLRENRLYVACQTDDDLPYVLAHAGEDNIVIGSDYGHADTSTEMEALRRLRDTSEIDPSAVRKIVYDNPKALYAV